MKTKKLIPYLLLILATFSACQKFLTEEPLSSFSEQAAFSNASNAKKAILGVYSPLSGDNGYGSRFSLFFPYDNDEMVGSSNNSVPDNNSRDVARYDVLPTHPFLDPSFRRLYSGIERANICIKNIPKMAGYESGADKVELRRMHGEALTLRAQYYFELVRVWGDVPAQFVPSADMPDLNIPKTDRDTIYNQILRDLAIAKDLVPWRNESGVAADERITKGAVKGLRARIALFRGGYSLRKGSNQMERKSDYLTYYKIARDECQEIMQNTAAHRLNPSFESIFRNSIDARRIEPNGEVMFEAVMAGEAFETDGKLGLYNGPRVNGRGNGSLFIVPAYFYSFDQMDKRRDVTIAPYVVNASQYRTAQVLVNTYDGKFRRDWISNPVIEFAASPQYFSLNWPILRLSDVILMFAEAENELNGPTVAALDAINMVRRRSWATGVRQIQVTNGGNAYTTVPTVTITGGGGTGAQALPTIAGGKITAINVVYTGDTYTSAPTISISGGGGSGAAATATISTLANADIPSGISKDDFFQAIVKERSLEFGSEGIRKYDLIRWNLLEAKLNEAKQNSAKIQAAAAPYQNVPRYIWYKNNSTDLVIYNSFYAPDPTSAPTGYTRVAWGASISTTYGNVLAPKFKANHSELMPIPQTAIDANPLITQDYGY